MNCSEVDDALIAMAAAPAAQLPPQAEEHLKSCKRCEELARALKMSGASDAPSPTMLTQIQRGMTADLRPVRPVAPSRHFFLAFAGMFVLIVSIGVYRLGAFALTVMSPLQTVAMLSALAVCAGLTTWSLVGQMVPGSRHRISPGLLPVLIVFSLALVMAISFQVQNEHNFWIRSWFCIKAGTSLGLLAGVPFWLLLRRGAVLSPRVAGAGAGLLAGLAGTSLLEMHCPNLDVWHILVSHLGVAVLGAAVGFITGMIVETLDRRSFDRRHKAIA